MLTNYWLVAVNVVAVVVEAIRVDAGVSRLSLSKKHYEILRSVVGYIFTEVRRTSGVSKFLKILLLNQVNCQKN